MISITKDWLLKIVAFSIVAQLSAVFKALEVVLKTLITIDWCVFFLSLANQPRARDLALTDSRIDNYLTYSFLPKDVNILSSFEYLCIKGWLCRQLSCWLPSLFSDFSGSGHHDEIIRLSWQRQSNIVHRSGLGLGLGLELGQP